MKVIRVFNIRPADAAVICGLILTALKTLDTFGNCQRPVISLVVSQYMHQTQTCENLDSILVFEVARE